MIHPAMACNPCKHGICEYEGDCETCIAQERIRELEAALETKTTWWLKEKARAERVEAAARTEAGAAQIHFEARQHLEARVAELEHRHAPIIKQEPDYDEAREREAG